MEKIRFMVADDHPAFRKGLCRMLEDEEDFECVGQAADGIEAIHLADEKKPDVVLMDISMPKLDGTQAAREIHERCSETAIIILSAFNYDAFVYKSLCAGVKAYILKTTPLDFIVNTIRLVKEGNSILNMNTIYKLLKHFHLEDSDSNDCGNICLEMLSPRELEVIDLAAKGMSNKSIANKLFISRRTVQTHLANIFRKLGVNTRTQAMLNALTEGWIVLEDASR